MTLVIAIPTDNSIIFASDSQVTIGDVRATASKIYKLNENCLWSASGDLGLIQRVREQIDQLPNKQEPLVALRDTIAGFIKQTVTALVNMDFRSQFMGNSAENLLKLHLADFLFVECYDQKKPQVLHIVITGTTEWVENRFAATGNGQSFALALLQKYSQTTLTTETAKLLAYKVIEESIQIGAYGLGPPIDVYSITWDKGARQADESERAGLEDAARMLRWAELELLSSHGALLCGNGQTVKTEQETNGAHVKSSPRAKIAKGGKSANRVARRRKT
ncbi:MAG: hypothetical protein JSS83_23235 [Cyanobacteria bacterium SZAS LIN-3]|nr:hypothetical protein [Cyanobacteria bacterium SZAS LIN-3]